MNSLYKNYIKNTVILFLVVIFFSVFFFFMNNREYYNFSEKIYMLDIICVYILIFILYKDRNKKTGIFVQSLPLKTTNTYIFKTMLSVVFVIAVAIFQLLIACFFEDRSILHNFHKSIEHLFIGGTDYNGDYYYIHETIHEVFILLICEVAALTLSVNLIGVIGLALVAPIAAFLCTVLATAGITRFADILVPGIMTYWDVYRWLGDIIGFVLFDFNINTLILYSIVILIISCIINKYIDYSNIGRMFFFKKLYIPFSVLVSLIGGFALFYVVIGLYDMYISSAAAVILALICIFICSRIFKSIHNYYK